MASPERPDTFRRPTRWSVKAGDAAARWVITLGGIGTIVAVSGVFLFLLSVVAPLFAPASLSGPRSGPAAAGDLALVAGKPLAWSAAADGTFTVIDLDKGTVTTAKRFDPPATAVARDGEALAFGLADGRVRLGRVEDKAGVPTPVLEPALPAAAASPVRQIELLARPGGPVFATRHDDGRCFVLTTVKRENLITGETEVETEGGRVPIDTPAGAGPPGWLVLTGSGDNLLAVWPDGLARRYLVGNPAKARLAEEARLTEGGAKVTAVCPVAGRETVLVGDSTGRIGAWFKARPPAGDAATADGRALVRGHDWPGSGSAVTALAAAHRSRLAAAAFADGTARLFHVTSERTLAALTPAGGPADRLAFAPDDKALAVRTPAGLALWGLEARHPEASPKALFAPVWYEGYPRPEHVWQSSSGSEGYEPKYGFWPLIHGTVKATLYALLFAVPVALLAAIYTSEFLSPRARLVVKPAVELMASLPSVVLGFVGALVLAPLVEDRVPAVLLVAVTVPGALLLGGHLWQLLPAGVAVRWRGLRLPLAFAAVAGGLAAAWALGGPAERLLFAGDLKAWLDGRGRPFPGWLALLFVPAAFAVTYFGGRPTGDWLRSKPWTRTQRALGELARFLAAGVAAAALSAFLALVLDLCGFDPRGGVVGTYVQRNALVVGMMMGFAIIPLIYTIAEDALAAVPDHLRAASLGCGATPWQTAVRVVVPTAVSGLFAAVMIGLGRAAGETMIVLMAAGNTPVMDWNIFNGFRTLSANLAVELPEAAQGDTHFRTLYLAALVLFALTFVVNTLAEVVRLRFRKRAHQL